MSTHPILIVGAGPTGLVLGVSLAQRGTPFRLISAAKGPGEQSRALAVHARTLEFYRQFGFADAVVAEGIRTRQGHLRETGSDGVSREVASFDFNDLGGGISPYPFILTYAQDDHERFLVQQLKEAGAAVEWGAKLTGFVQHETGARATIAHEDGRTEEADVSYICGCDGAHSQVRQSLGAGFPGGTYEQLFYVADARIDREFDEDLYGNLGAKIFALMLPVRSTGMQRLIGLVPPHLSERPDLTFDDIRGDVETLLNVRVTDLNWFATYRVHHRVAEHFRVGRAFLLGDAAHIHSPAGGQGMNTGIGDAVNLGWKLADVLAGRAAPLLLDSYEPERIGFAKKLVATTDRAFTNVVAEGLSGEIFRRFIAPMTFMVMTQFEVTRHAAFRTLSQTRVHYRGSPLSEGEAGHVRGGDRLPWTGSAGEDNFAPLRSCDWQVHVYGEAEAGLDHECAALRLPMHVFAWSEAASRAGLKRGGTYLIRPDGYVATAAATGGAAVLRSYVDRFALKL
jgi:2-polyprenyl-6-methoxyphenol hydroxylase-like FAD-dependent oxidoreductase